MFVIWCIESPYFAHDVIVPFLHVGDRHSCCVVNREFHYISIRCKGSSYVYEMLWMIALNFFVYYSML